MIVNLVKGAISILSGVENCPADDEAVRMSWYAWVGVLEFC